ncbi:hypothetical protein BJF88_10550 [Cellulosimicrobium sp. CUA-896]|nr:hypothetical protein BJF88_10550 [Cellulosimicrobium sp. CUA-896]
MARYVPTGEPSAVAWPPTSRSVFDEALTNVDVPSPVVDRIHCAASGVSATSAGASTSAAEVSSVTESCSPVAAFVTAYRVRFVPAPSGAPSAVSSHACSATGASVRTTRPSPDAAGASERSDCTPSIR